MSVLKPGFILKDMMVFRVMPYAARKDEPPETIGGLIELNDEIRQLFQDAFIGKINRRIKKQPFHFNFSGTDREHEVRTCILRILEGDQAVDAGSVLANRLSMAIDDRTGELLLTVGRGSDGVTHRCTLWVYPADLSLQFRQRQGTPEIAEIKDAFSRSSDARKAAFFDSTIPASRNDLVSGILIDRTAGLKKGSSDYWLGKFLDARIDLLPARGTAILLKGLKAANEKAKSPEEKSSVRAIYDELLAGNASPTSLADVQRRLVGEAHAAYGKEIPKTIQSDARFEIDSKEVALKIKNRVFVLTNGVEVYFPEKSSLDPEDYIQRRNGKRFLVMDKEIVDRFYR